MENIKAVCDERNIKIIHMNNINNIQTIHTILTRILDKPNVLFIYESHNKSSKSNNLINEFMPKPIYKNGLKLTLCFFLDEYYYFYDDELSKVSFIKFIDKANINIKCNICFEEINKTNNCNKCGVDYCNKCFVKLIEDGRSLTCDDKNVYLKCCFCKQNILVSSQPKEFLEMLNK